MMKCEDFMKQFTLHPGAVARQLIANLKAYKPLSKEDSDKVLDAIKSTGIPDVEDRMLADLSRDTLKALLKSI